MRRRRLAAMLRPGSRCLAGDAGCCGLRGHRLGSPRRPSMAVVAPTPLPHCRKAAAATSQATAGSSPTQLDSRQRHRASARRQRNYRSRLAADVRVRKCEPVRPRLVGRLHIEGHVLTKRGISFANYTFYISLAINSLST